MKRPAASSVSPSSLSAFTESRVGPPDCGATRRDTSAANAGPSTLRVVWVCPARKSRPRGHRRLNASAAPRRERPAARFCASPTSSGLPRRRAKFRGLRWRVERVRPPDSWTWAPGRHVAPRAPGGPLRPGARVKRLADGRRRGAHRWRAAGAALRPPSSLAGELSRRRAKPLLRLRPRNWARLTETPPAAGRRA
jgi:hypothetical protein